MDMDQLGACHKKDNEILEPAQVKAPSIDKIELEFIDERLQKAALDGDLGSVRRLVDDGASVNAPLKSADSEEGDVFITLMHALSSRPDLPNGKQVLAELVGRRANLNARSSLGLTPLARACLNKNTAAASLLVESGADSRPLDDKGRNALNCAVLLGAQGAFGSAPREPANSANASGELVSLLASSRADVNRAGSQPPLLQAIHSANRPAVESLLRHGAKPRFLHAAVDSAPAGIVEELLRGKASPVEEDTDGRTVLDVAFRRGNEVITSLVRDFIGDLERHKRSASGRGKAVLEEAKARTTKQDDDDEAASGGGLGLAAVAGDTKDNRQSVASGILTAVGGHTMLTRTRMATHELLPPVERGFGRLQAACRQIALNQYFQSLMFAALFSVLFMPDLWVVAEVENNDGLDGFLVVVLFLFLMELFVQAVGTPKTYIGSFFFWMDILGILSVPLDHSLVSDAFPRTMNPQVMRTARIARLGARAGRFTKLVKLLRFLPGVRQEGAKGTADRISNALLASLSTRVACLIILMVVVLPLFELATYPTNDYSMQTWLDTIEFALANDHEDLYARVEEFADFYSDKDYFPYEVYCTSPNGTKYSWLTGRVPLHRSDSLEIRAESDVVYAVFNFGPQNRVDSIMNILLILVIIILMVGFSLLLSNSISTIVRWPLAHLFRSVREMSAMIFKTVFLMAAQFNPGSRMESVGDTLAGICETEILEKVVEKLEVLGSITKKSSGIDEQMDMLNENERAMMQAITSERMHHRDPSGNRKQSRASVTSGLSQETEGVLDKTLERYLQELGVSWELVNSWNFDILDVEERQRNPMCLFFLLFHSGRNVQQQCYPAFVEAASQGYTPSSKAPYHNWFHAIDVTHCVFRMLMLCGTTRFLSSMERLALVVSAVCHDIGHPGLNNPYLVETSHELAMRYNDQSPLENMHTARMFEIVRQPKTAIFSELESDRYREVRQVCIEAILHTDNVHHFPMIKELQMLYEMNSHAFDAAFQANIKDPVQEYPPKDIIDIFSEGTARKLIRKSLLHLSDISNPMKPFEICRKWAWNIIDEFFLQGDLEKELGIAVQPLNDREKVNKPNSQVGFIEFFVAPCGFSTVRILPPLVPLTDQMMHNLTSWAENWLETTPPLPDAEEQAGAEAKLQERIAKLESKYGFRDIAA